MNYDIDIHNPEGSGTLHHYFKLGEYYSIPYRCITPKGVNNLLTAGRCISTTHETQVSYHIMPVCMYRPGGRNSGTDSKKHGAYVKSIDITVLKNRIISQDGIA